MEKRSNLWWDRFFLGMAEYMSRASKDPSTKVGAVLVEPHNNIVVGLGYNGFPRKVHDTVERYQNREMKYQLVVHAEVNAILMAGEKAQGSHLYVYPSFALPPICNECCKVAIQAGVQHIIGYIPNETDERVKRWKDSISISKQMCNEANVLFHGVLPNPDDLPVR